MMTFENLSLQNYMASFITKIWHKIFDIKGSNVTHGPLVVFLLWVFFLVGCFIFSVWIAHVLNQTTVQFYLQNINLLLDLNIFL